MGCHFLFHHVATNGIISSFLRWTIFHYIYIHSSSSILVSKSCPTLATPWSVAYQAPLSMGFSRQEYWSGLPFPSPYIYIYTHTHHILFIYSVGGLGDWPQKQETVSTQGWMSYWDNSLPLITGAHMYTRAWLLPKFNNLPRASPAWWSLSCHCLQVSFSLGPVSPALSPHRCISKSICPNLLHAALSQSLLGDPNFRHAEETHAASSAWVPAPSLGLVAPMSWHPSCGVWLRVLMQCSWNEWLKAKLGRWRCLELCSGTWKKKQEKWIKKSL